MDKSYSEIVKLAKHYKAIGQTDVYLSYERGNERALPWEHVVSVEPGVSHRLDMSTSVQFVAMHPSGLMFRWSVDIEEAGANGRGHYMVDVGRLTRILGLLPPKAQGQFRKYLGECAEAVIKSAEKYEAVAGRERSTASSLAHAATAGSASR